MRIKDVRIKAYKRFHDLALLEVPASARLVVLTGPNGSGKSSLFDGFRMWQGAHGLGISGDKIYAQKRGLPDREWSQYVEIAFHEPDPVEERLGKTFYFRTAYRNDPDFTLSSLTKMGQVSSSVNRFIDNDATVTENYQRLVSASVEGIYSGDNDEITVKDLREKFVSQLRKSMIAVFDDLVLSSLGDPLREGAFFFGKGLSKDFHYKNLSGGEKAAFDLLLDVIVKRSYYDNSIYCIDEPELHLHTRLQGKLLEELLRILPPDCQMWIASHSIGMMRKARDLQAVNQSEVVFLDFQNVDFDASVELRPAQVDRKFWARTLEIALDDLAHLVAPRRIVLCEGKPVSSNAARAELDAACYRKIFDREYPETDFVSVGNASDVQTDRLGIGKAIQAVVSGTTVVRLVDRDDRSTDEISDLQKEGVRVLTKRHIEAYLMDDEVLSSLCESLGHSDKTKEILEAKLEAITNSTQRGNATDDVKSASGELYVQIRRILQVTQLGNTVDAFLRDTLAELVVPGTAVYTQLKGDIFDE
jgi:predicted ATPase